MKLAEKFGASLNASAREFARTNYRDCLVIVLNPIEFVAGSGARAHVRRIEPSPSFRTRFPVPALEFVTLDHALGRMLPIGRRMVRPTSVVLKDRNGDDHDCLAEAFDTKHNILLLLYPVRALTGTTIIMPSGFKLAG